MATPCASSWGAKGYSEYWCNESNAWTYRHLHVAAERMVELARRHPTADPLTLRALNQAARELMLAQSSDWTFIMKTGTTVPYATRRINEHILQFNKLYDDVKSAKVLRSVPGLDDAAVGAVMQWKFTQTLLNGTPVQVLMTVTVNFSLQ